MKTGGAISTKINIASFELLPRLDGALHKFSDDVRERIETAQRLAHERLESIDERCREIERELIYWEDQYDSADDEEDDTDYLAYKREEAAERLAEARRMQRRVEESFDNLARACRRVNEIAGGRLVEARSLLRRKYDELNDYANIAVPGTDGGGANSTPPSAHHFNVSAGAPDSGDQRAERLTPEEVAARYREISQNGHAVQKHGYEMSEQQLDKRVLYGIDPTGGAKNKFGRHATKFTSAQSLVKAEDYLRRSEDYQDSLADAAARGRESFVVIVKLENVFGGNYKSCVFGKSRIGTVKNPLGTTATDFTNGTIKAVYVKDAGNWNLETMYPEPAKTEIISADYE